MPYCTQADILMEISEEKLAQLTDDDGGGESINDDNVSWAIEKAAGEIDSYGSKKFATPVAPPIPNSIVRVNVSLAIYWLHYRRAADVGSINEVIDKQHDKDCAWLLLLSQGKVSLGPDPPPASASTTGGAFNADKRKLTHGSLKGF
jgi:phage gp36-like protein